MRCILHLKAPTRETPDVLVPQSWLRDELEQRYGGIRCPLCAWRPRREDRWYCSCGHRWNTFDTAGVCPACAVQWTETECLRCERWSLHMAWYEGDAPRGDAR